jgi:hypothetical protein
MQLRPKTGNSIAEFAVVISLMAILIGAGQVRFSQSTEQGKTKKSAETINKIIMAANNFYLDKNLEEGIGRFPGQDKWNQNVPFEAGYDSLGAALAHINDWVSYTNTNTSSWGQNWVSVFGKENAKARILGEHSTKIQNDDSGSKVGQAEWAEYIDVMKNPFQDGHYIYTVIGGNDDRRPTIIVTDFYQPAAEYVVLQP